MTTPRKGNPVTEFLRGKKFQLTGTMFFPHLLQPKIEPNKAPKFGLMIAWDNHENQQVAGQIQQLLMQVKQQFHPTIPDHAWTNPLKDFHTTKRNDGKAHPKYLTNKKWMNASNNEKFAPQVMMLDQSAPNGMRLATAMDSMQIFDGQKCVVSISFFGLHGENSKYGVSTNIDAVLVVGGGERVMTDVGVDVNQAFGSFLGQMGMNPAQQAPAQNYQQQAPQQQPAQGQQYQGSYNGPGGPGFNGYNNGNGGGLV